MSKAKGNQRDADRALIIGSSGLLGNALMHRLTALGRGCAVCNRKRSPYLSDPQFRIEELDQIGQNFDIVYLLAAHIPYANMTTYSPSLIEANVALAHKVSKQFPESRIVFSSSVSVYGTPMQRPMTESHPYNQPNAYGMSKISAESILRAHQSFCILRFSSLYGIGMRRNTFLPTIIDQAIESRKIKLHGDGTRLQNYLSVKDAAAILTTAADSQHNSVVHATANQSHSNREIAEIVASQVGNTEILYLGTDCSPSFEYSTVQWNQLFNYRTHVPIEDGIRELIDDVRKN